MPKEKPLPIIKMDRRTKGYVSVQSNCDLITMPAADFEAFIKDKKPKKVQGGRDEIV
ncbi:hypothetical protein [Polluticaenibacter yanchengensis]|uniref:Prevent-host-death protein n=1 Tax=Polluticaenibacter yanchengensis TaxID=3014562 RepID=A0ABT4UIM9_9BACT|nr:hypothetical protein [Chitinophagaceae bacterium LY-5]